ncbi:MAG: FCD domain-containing protein [Terricaulis sp.]
MRRAWRGLREIDTALDRAIQNGDAEAYMEGNHAFHFTLYRAQERRTMTNLIEMLWLQFGPFMRTVYGRLGTAHLVDQHHVALDAIVANDVAALKSAIAADIEDGMGLIGRSGFVSAEAAATP